jgi:antitoxin component of RelBE/YafQ-DinJ toxin-antitoxin module
VSEVVYIRVPEALKQALRAQAEERGLSLTRAARELIERGLEQVAAQQSLPESEDRQAVANMELEKTRARLNRAEVELRAAKEREQLTARTYAAVAERAASIGTLEPVVRMTHPSTDGRTTITSPVPVSEVDARLADGWLPATQSPPRTSTPISYPIDIHAVIDEPGISP